MSNLSESPVNEGEARPEENTADPVEIPTSEELSGQGNDTYRNAQQLSVQEWNDIIETNRLLHGFQIHSEASGVVRARRPVFKLRGPDHDPDPVDGIKPCFQVVDESNIQVHETTNAFQRSLAQNAFSKRCIDTELSAGDMGIQAGLSGSRGREHSTTEESSSLSEGQEYHASYNFPRARIFLGEYELALSEDCEAHLEEIETKQTLRSLRHFEAKFGMTDASRISLSMVYRNRSLTQTGHVFVTSVLLGGQQRTVKFSGAMQLQTHEQKKDAVRGALGAKIVAPYVSASLKYSRGRGSGASHKDEEYADLSYLGMSSRGGDTLIGADVPNWSKTVALPQNWRVIENEIAEPLGSLIAAITEKEYIPGLFLWIRNGHPKPATLTQLRQEQRYALQKWLKKKETVTVDF